MNELTKIFEEHPVRIAVENEETLFVGKDVCAILGFKNPNKAMNDHCDGITKRYPIADSLGRKQSVRVLVLSDVMRLICNSQLPAAKRFEKWVFEDVLPTIMHTGSYSIQPPQPPMLTTDAQCKDVMKRMKEEVDKKLEDLVKLEGSQNRTRLVSIIPKLTDFMCEIILTSVWRRFGIKPEEEKGE